MGTIISCCWRHSYDTASIQFRISEWELQERPAAFVAEKWAAVGVTNPRVHELTYTRIRRFIKTTTERDVYCKVSGDLRGEEVEVLVC
jgi:P2-related tail formation protein